MTTTTQTNLHPAAKEESPRLPFAGGPGSDLTYGPFQCGPRCLGTKENPCTIALHRNGMQTAKWKGEA